ncbi:Ada metal-binding domain-containing protein [Galbitalea sp. SE-J8]|uniref:AlkA N-terminal domain-containing protein n=1 Tax=Galbitalea sp. SE-J8 TaxID=3054952 RepID=UPI00259C75C5|nr:AlkA N-terminal domain-containing protein [Galbitalea sp. SE-J8]MDM4762607.1 Ada metal-binding domain-containing protein [Galbitalea sp. SE-J8]
MTDALFAERYRALSSRDARFDGQFIAGVTSTGIYCRPSCPAMTPKPGNVRFFRTAAAAHEAGLRACKRCIPDAVPGSPEWNVRDDVASRAMRLIADGVVEREGVPGLAAQLGYSSRQLGRILHAELGAGPLALARAHRASTARELLVSSDLTVADIAFAAGFASVRQFNETMRAVYELTPTQIRARAPRRDARPGATDAGATDAGAADPGATDATGVVSLRLPARAPFDGAGVLAYLGSHAAAGVEHLDADGVFSRALRLPGGVAEVRISLETDAVRVRAALPSLADLAPLVSRIRRLFDLDADSAAIDAVLGADPVLAPLVAARPGMRLPGSVDPFETLLRTMLGQQISIAAANTVSGRVAREASGDPRVLPTAAELAERGPAVLRGPARRVAAILAVAGRAADGTLRLDVARSHDELRADLEAQPGIGPWTAGYVAMRVLGSPDVLLAGDLVLRANAERLGLPADPRRLSEIGERWAPWRSYAGMHVWRAPTLVP